MAEPAGPKEDVYIDVPLGGLETGLDAERVEAGKALVATDVHFRDEGAVGRRPLFGALSSTLEGIPRAIGAMDGNIAIFNGDGSAAIFDTEAVRLTDVTSFSGAPVNVRTKAIHHGGRPSAHWSSAIIGHTACVVWYSGDLDQGTDADLTGASFIQSPSDDATIMFMLVDTTTGVVIKPPTVWREVDSSVCEWANASVRTIGNHFVIVSCLRQVASAQSPFWWVSDDATGILSTLEVGSISATGAVTDASSSFASGILCWDFHSYPGESMGFVYANQLDPGFAALSLGSGKSDLFKFAVNTGTGIVTVTSVQVTATSDAFANAGLTVVFHNGPQNVVILASGHRVSATDTFAVYSHVVSEGLTVLSTGHLLSATQYITNANSPFPWIQPHGDLSEVNHAFLPQVMYMNGAFAQLDANGESLALFWQGYSNVVLFAARSVDPAASGRPDFMLGVAQTHVDGLTGVSLITTAGAGDYLPVDAHVLLCSKPWWDPALQASFALCATAPPASFRTQDVGTAPGPPGLFYLGGKQFASSRRNLGSYAYQQACFVVRISPDTVDDGSGRETPKGLLPVGVCNVDLQQTPITGGLQTLPQVYETSANTWVGVTAADVWNEAPPVDFRMSDTHGVSGRLVVVRDFEEGEICPQPIDGGLWVGEGSHRLFDGLNLVAVPTPVSQPITFEMLPTSSYELDVNTPIPTASHSLFTTFSGKVIRSGVVEGERRHPAVDATQVDPVFALVGVFFPPFSAALVQGEKRLNGEPYVPLYINDALRYNVPVRLYDRATWRNYDGVNFYRFIVEDLNVVDDLVGANAIPHYMDSGELGAELPAGAVCVAARRDRVFYVDCDDPFTVRSSKLIGPAHWLEFNQNLYARIPDTEGGITALGAMDDKLLVFTDTGIYYLAGDGPNNVGRGDWGAPRRVASSVGCIDKRSVLAFDGGVAFLSKRGLDLIDRNLVLSSIGSPVQDYFDEVLAGDRTLCGAVNIGENSELRWVTRSPDGFTDIIVFNYSTGRWSLWENIFGSSEINPTIPVSTCVANDIHYILTKRTFSGNDFYTLQRESLTNFDGDLRYSTSWLRLQGQQDYFRAKTLFLSGYWPDMDTGATLVVTIEFDYGKSNAPDETHTVSQANLTRNASGYFEAKIGLQNQKCESAKITISMNSTGSTPYEETRIINIGLEVAPMEGGNKMPYTTTTVT